LKIKRKKKEKILLDKIDEEKKKNDELKSIIQSNSYDLQRSQNKDNSNGESSFEESKDLSSNFELEKSLPSTNQLNEIISSEGLEDGLTECARTGKVEQLEKLLSLGVDMNVKDENGYSPLHWAAINGKLDCMALLIKAGADINQTDHGGWTALHYAAFKNRLDCVGMLAIQSNLETETKNSSKKTAAQLTTNKLISAMIKEAKNPVTRKLLDFSAIYFGKFQKNSLEENLPPDIKEKEQQLIKKEKELLQKESEIFRIQAELQFFEETIKKKQKEEVEKRDDLKKKEEKLSVIQEEISKKLENQGESELANSIFITNLDNLIIMEEVGKGSFGSVYKASWRGDLVAAKKLKCKIEDVSLIQSFQKETLLLSKMRHPNIVMLMAASCRAPELIIITELMKSDLSILVQSKEKIEWKERIQMATDIARGMTYLHNMEPPMVHRDLKTGNCLVDEYRRVKISDFGTAVTLNLMGTELVGTAAYMSPERLREEQSDEKTDVFSFGVILWELLTRKFPWEGLSNIQIVARAGFANELLAVPEQPPKGCPPSYLNLILDCCDRYNSKRPSFETLLKLLREMQ